MTGAIMVQFVEALLITGMGPDLALRAFGVGGDPDVLARKVELVEEAYRRAVPAAKLAASLQIGGIDDLGYPASAFCQIIRIKGWLFLVLIRDAGM